MAEITNEHIPIDFQFDSETTTEHVNNAIIKIFGVGGGGSNAVNYMFTQGIKDVDFIVCNTDKQALANSPVSNQIQIGKDLTNGLGAGSNPKIGKDAAEENSNAIRESLSDGTKMVFITAGMGGGTGTGAAPVVASIAKDLGLLTIGIVTTPFSFEGPKRIKQATIGIDELKKNVDAIIIIDNNKIREQYADLKIGEAYAKADNILASAAKGISDIITSAGHINVDFEDVKTTMENSGVAIMGFGTAEGENRAINAVEKALNCSLLNNTNINGAQNILINIKSSPEDLGFKEVEDICEYVQKLAGGDANLIHGTGYDDSLGKSISVTLVATNFNTPDENSENTKATVYNLEKETTDNEILSKNEEDGIKTFVKNQPVIESSSDNLFSENISIPQIAEENRHKEVLPLFEENEVANNSTEDCNTEKTSLYDNPLFAQPTSTVQPIVTPNSNGNENIAIISEQNEQVCQNITAKQNDRRADLSQFNYKNKEAIAILENTSAYVRRGVQLMDSPSSDESIISKYTLGEDDDKKLDIKNSNTFLHDNVD